MRAILYFLLGLSVSSAWATDVDSHAGHGAAPYAGQHSRDIKALSSEEVAAYLAGAGMGFAKAAELNRYPGPMHSLEHATALGLSASQREALEALMRSHKDEARRLGAEVIRLERELDGMFAHRNATAASVDTKVMEIAAAQARVRASHLKTHLLATKLLTPEQVARYDTLRGYSR